MKLLVSRTDRLGDVLLSLPALNRVRETAPDAEVYFLARSQPLEAVRPWLRAKNIFEVAFDSDWPGGIEAALVLFEDTEVFSRLGNTVPLRVGPLSKLGSFFHLSHPVRQRRSRADRHEAEYNLELADRLMRALGYQPRVTSPPIEIPVESRARERAGEVLAKIGFRGDLPFFVLHPGMGGSAANLTAPHYLRLLRDVEAELGAAPVLSAGPAERDQALVRELRAARPDLPVVEGLSLAELREVFRRSGLVIAPSTGPLHLAHYVGTATLGLYSPVQSQRWERWAPRGGTGKSFVLAPRIACSARRRCFGTSCPEYFCLDRMDWRGLISQAADDLKRNGGAG